MAKKKLERILEDQDNIKEQELQDALRYGDYADRDTDVLLKMRKRLMDYVENGKTRAFVRKLHELLEVERELTLREGE